MTIDFEQHRSHLRGVAYRMLGSLAEADDAVQEAWLRLDRAEPSGVANPRGWLTTVVARVCLDMLRTRTSRREEPLDQRADRPAATDAEEELMLADAVGLALLVVLDKLEPAERLAFVLHDLFGVPFEEIAAIVSRSPDATRQLASRARRRVQGSAAPDAERANQRHTVEAFIAALRRGDVTGMIAVLDPEVVGRAVDEAGTVREVRGARNWASGAVAFARLASHMAPALIDGSVGLVMAPQGRLFRALRFTFEGGRIASAEVIADRARLDALDIATIEGLPPIRPGHDP
ncbi:MAG TPA: sigma-70 family RNA polymerase sigma factor [Polyangiaceae bacterium]|nr:sigma-70 family RNA polymerase sigma factor [Polyangiaceae bacterium]